MSAVRPQRRQVRRIANASDRPARLLVPSSGPTRGLAVELHGSGLDVERQLAMSRLDERLLSEGVALLLPQAAIPFTLKPQMATGFAWNVPQAPLPGGPDDLRGSDVDVAWLDDLVIDVQSRMGLARSALFVTGYSGGARLASHLVVCGRANWTAAALVAGLRAAENGRRAPPPTIAFHGARDGINRYLGGQGPRWDAGVEDAALRYASAQGCAATPEDSTWRGARRRRFRRGEAEVALTLYTVLDAAHAWPGSSDSEHLEHFGPAGTSIDASALICEFFAEKLRPRVPGARSGSDLRPSQRSARSAPGLERNATQGRA